MAYNVDCMEFMRSLPDKAFDLCVADPPYGINITTRHLKKEQEPCATAADTHTHTHTHTHTQAPLVGGGGRPFGGVKRAAINGGYSKGRQILSAQRRIKVYKVNSAFYPVFDDSSPPDAECFRELERVSKKLIIWGGNYFLDKLGPASCMIVWDKKRRGMDQADCEIAWTNLPGQSRIFDYKWNGMLQEDMKNKEKRIHPTQKPVNLYKMLFSRYAEKGERIFDPFLGSGSSRIAAYDLGFDFTGCELSKVYFDLQENRFTEHTAQENLFLMMENENGQETEM